MRARVVRCARDWAWLCPPVMLVLAAGILMLFGITVWTAGLVALLLVCPAVLIWGALHVRGRSTKG